jgi:hypothetical protein
LDCRYALDDGQPQIQVQAHVAMIDFGLDIQEALKMPSLIAIYE